MLVVAPVFRLVFLATQLDDDGSRQPGIGRATTDESELAL